MLSLKRNSTFGLWLFVRLPAYCLGMHLPVGNSTEHTDPIPGVGTPRCERKSSSNSPSTHPAQLT